MIVTDDDITTLRNEALAAGDHELVATCHDALPGSTRWEPIADWGETRPVPRNVRVAAIKTVARIIDERATGFCEICKRKFFRKHVCPPSDVSPLKPVTISRELASAILSKLALISLLWPNQTLKIESAALVEALTDAVLS